MKYKKLNKNKGVAGLEVLLSVIAMLFMIGLIIMIFVIAGSNLQTSVKDTASSGSTLQTLYNVTSGTSLTECTSQRDGTIGSLVSVVNATDNTITFLLGNFSTNGCVISNTTADYNWDEYQDLVNVTYTYNYLSNPEAVDVINSTKISVASTVDWFDIIVVLTALVVLVLLIMIIIASIRNSGLIGNA